MAVAIISGKSLWHLSSLRIVVRLVENKSEHENNWVNFMRIGKKIIISYMLYFERPRRP